MTFQAYDSVNLYCSTREMCANIIGVTLNMFENMIILLMIDSIYSEYVLVDRAAIVKVLERGRETKNAILNLVFPYACLA